ncbi:MAG: malto-oligosyltrehalose trehalohydrolase [Nocardioides sp.]|jgi:malto-oligosyltrehalose trehalohydrolase
MRIPASTYRLQITDDFDLLAAARTLAYLHDLGIDWVYLSPLLAAESGSSHGYDVSDHSAIDPSRGRGSGLSALSSEARRLGMGVLVDIVPNHVGIARPYENPWWWHVLTHGESSEYASAFDIDWAAGDGRVLIPVVGDDDLLDDGRIANLRVLAGELHYHDQRFPLAPDSAPLGPDEDANAVHARQNYELVSWRRADTDLNYRRFFSVNTLAAIRVEDPEWFARSHEEVARWFSEGLVDGLRIDHPDGLRDPGGYLRDLADLTDGAYVLVEKILEPGEALPSEWDTAGTTGYDALALIDRVLTDPAGEEPLGELESRLRGSVLDWPALIHGTKRDVTDHVLRAEVRRIVRELAPLVGDGFAPPVGADGFETLTSSAPQPPDSSVVEEGAAPPVVEEGEARPVVEEGEARLETTQSSGADGFETLTSFAPQPTDSSVVEEGAAPPVVEEGAARLETTPLEDAVAELLACFPVYRSYLPLGREHLEEAFALARQHRPDLHATLDLLEPILGDGAADATQRFQQTSGMVMAKGVEDCAFYRTSRLTSLNEVGGDPSVFSLSVDDFHTAMAPRQAEWPAAMTAASTHDTKRGEDVRARIGVLAEIPQAWTAAVEQVQQLAPIPDPNFANLLWQAVVGAWSHDPALRERLHAYAEKAMREAGDRTTWTDPDEAYESSVHAAINAAFDNEAVRAILDEVLDQIVDAGWFNALSAKLLGLTLPGVPDLYQGSELWEQSLVDPDNRRSVDFETRAEALAELGVPVLTGGLDDPGLAKLLVVTKTLQLRRDEPGAFESYAPVRANGEASDHVVAYDRGGVVAVATRLPLGLAKRGGWGETTLELAPGRWRDEFTGEVFASDGAIPLANVLSTFPVALLRPLPHRSRQRGTYDVWAPRPERVRLQLGDETIEMKRGAGDWWHPTETVEERTGVDYGYLLDDDETVLPNPRSRWQPHGVHGPSRTFDPDAFAWTDRAWTGRQLAGSVLYELHLGTFTPEGTLDAAIEKLPHLRDIGVDLIELMPVNAFNGEHGWGYDGVLWGCVHEAYGGPAAYQRFVDAAHAHGLGVIQDVVHNHIGPSGNYLPRFGPYVTSDSNDWGDRINLDEEGSEEVRRFILDSVTSWLRDFHVDGLRLDAIHALVDSSETHLLEELSTEVGALSAHLGRPLTLIAESDLNDPLLITPREGGGTGIDAQWSDDFHHALHVALTGETDGYYADFAPLSALAKVCEQGFFHDGTYSSFRGRDHGAPLDVARVPGWRLVVANSNHDQVGNRARGDRPDLDVDQAQVAALLTLAGPFTPMLFQGEEWGATTPFAFFTSHPEADLGEAVSAGRLREFARMGWDPDEVLDPQDPATFTASKLDWSETSTERGVALMEFYRSMAQVRRTLPALTDPDLRKVRAIADEDARTFVLHRDSAFGSVVVAVNFSTAEQVIDLGVNGAELVVRLATASGATLNEGVLTLPPHAGALLTSH